MTFRDLGLIPPILTALREQGYEEPSPIQAKAIPPALSGRDVLGCAQTGTGKTCAFAAPILQRLNAAPVKGRPIRALILTPTRELAIQIGESFAAYGAHLPLRCTVIFGGVGQNPQVEALRRGVDILVATPGRLGDLYQQKLLDLSNIEIFVLDEADRMLDMGFIHDVKRILSWLPSEKQTMLFSATMPPEITALVNSLLRSPARVAVDPVSSPVEAIRQSVYFVDSANKTRLLALLVDRLDVKNALVFTRTKHGANKVARDLGKAGISAAAIHGNKSQSARQEALRAFKAGEVRCLVATDIAARGLDIEELSHVFNYNLPEVPETYVHRIGRTGRAGHGGTAVSFCDFGEKPLLQAIEKLLGRPVPRVEGHPYPMQVFEAPKRGKNGALIHPDDEEARRAAREKRAQRAKAGPVDLPDPSSKGQAGKPTAPARPQPGPEPPARAAQVRQHTKLTRPGTRVDTGASLPRTDFLRPDPLSGDQIMDATARLLAPRKLQPEQNPPARDKGRRKAAQGETQGKGRRPQRDARPAIPEKSGPAAPPQVDRRRHPKSTGRRAAPEPRRSGRAKDSTEQKSLMKPFYLEI